MQWTGVCRLAAEGRTRWLRSPPLHTRAVSRSRPAPTPSGCTSGTCWPPARCRPSSVPASWCRTSWGTDVSLEQYEDQHHGYLRITATPTTLSGEYVVVAGHLNVGVPPQTVDTFAIDLAKGSVASTAPAKAT